MTVRRIDLLASDLFGNDAAEDELEEVFTAYALERPELERFRDPARPIAIARAYKGEGKSALLRMAQASVPTQDLVIAGPATTFVQSRTASDFAGWVSVWKTALVDKLAADLGGRLGVAWTDDAMALVEEAERAGTKPRNLIGAIISRLRPKLAGAGLGVEMEVGRSDATSREGALRRWTSDGAPVWLFVDDVDQNFENTDIFKQRVASFFVACRSLVNTLPQLRVRAAVRPNVWTTVKLEFEALSHVEQYISDLRWDEQQIRRLLARRVEGYLSRRGQSAPAGSTFDRDRELIARVFEDPMKWGGKDRPPHVILHTLSKHRPRWLVELCRVAAERSAQVAHERVTLDDVLATLGPFGTRRIQDTVAEFRSQCPEIDELIAAFNREPEEFATDDLVKMIDRKILNHLSPRIAGVVGKPTAMDIARFLYEVGIIFGRRDYDDGSYDHVAFPDEPSLLRARTNIDSGLRW